MKLSRGSEKIKRLFDRTRKKIQLSGIVALAVTITITGVIFQPNKVYAGECGLWDPLSCGSELVDLGGDAAGFVNDHVFEPAGDAAGFVNDHVFEPAGDAVGGLAGYVADKASSIGGVVGSLASGGWDIATALGGGAWGAITSVAGGAWDIVTSLAGGAWGAITSVAGGAWDAVTSIIGGALCAGKAVLYDGGLWGGAKCIAGGLWDAVKSLAGGAYGALKSIGGGVWGAVKGAFSGLWDAGKSILGGLWGTGKTIYKGMSNLTTSLIGKALNGGGSGLNIMETLKKVAEGVKKALGDYPKNSPKDDIAKSKEQAVITDGKKPKGWHDPVSFTSEKGRWSLHDLFDDTDLEYAFGEPLYANNKENGACEVTVGWACDPDDPNHYTEVHFYEGDENGSSGEKIGTTKAEFPRKTANGFPSVDGECGGNNKHGFIFPIPDSLKNGKDRYVYAYAMDHSPSGKQFTENVRLGGTGIKIKCDPPKNRKPIGWHDPTSVESERGKWTLGDLFSARDIEDAAKMSMPAQNEEACKVTVGWACDPDLDGTINVHFYKGDSSRPNRDQKLGTVPAKYERKDVAGWPTVTQRCGNKNHGFIFPIPDSLKTGRDEYIWAYPDDYKRPSYDSAASYNENRTTPPSFTESKRPFGGSPIKVNCKK